MTTEKEQINFNLSIIYEGLNAMASSSNEQLALNKRGLEYLDDVFDPMPLDYLPWLEDMKEVSQRFGTKFRDLYQQIEAKVGNLEWQEEDDFIIQDNQELQQWRKTAKNLLQELNERQ